MRSLWERAPRRGEYGKAAIRGMFIGILVALAAVAVALLELP
jgi:hypothetical protein